ncbi:MAG: formylglycine-generating enzyme family protein [Spirochaetaceae bacterium]
MYKTKKSIVVILFILLLSTIGSFFLFQFKPITLGSTGIEMVKVKAGSFNMGSNEGDSDEKPVFKVTIINDYFIGKYEVTQKEWNIIMEKNPSSFLGDDLPVDSVSWFDAIDFCNKLSLKEGLSPAYFVSGSDIQIITDSNGYRLPTEAQWEFVARGGNTELDYKYSGSNKAGDIGWYGSNSGNRSHIVGTKQPNDLGIYDLSGNVWEWCWDLYGSYNNEAQIDPIGSSTGLFRVLRGGGWSSYAASLRSCDRINSGADSNIRIIGFRIVLPVKSQL